MTESPLDMHTNTPLSGWEKCRTLVLANGSDFSFGKVREVDFVANPWKRTPPLEDFLVSSTIVTQWVEGNFEKKNLGLAAALFGDVNIDERFKKMAGSMTDYLRYGPNAEAAHGERIESQPFGSIRSPYFIPPLATERMAILFAVLTIFSNRKDRHVPVWKTSTLAVLACQHEKRLGLLQSTFTDIKLLQDSTGRTEVRLQ
ncbi:hypothetical protein CNMCM8927_001294 [Aspergillus lentulus]|uniref:Uncharacterized protein n=1 Tax=Aspergillus lentulus TaxID=293939 RepID=A0AAN5YHE4_ASPLE|nr:hypothetical protein CNMCM8927_001294 [Aspergillus lentulus]